MILILGKLIYHLLTKHPIEKILPHSAIIVLGMLMSIPPLAIDMYLPAFPTMAEYFGAEKHDIQLTLAAFLLGIGIGQLLIGVISDYFGRRIPLLLGLTLCFTSTLACVYVTSIHGFIFLRFLQGLGGASGVVLARAIVADCATGTRLSMLVGKLTSIMSLAPILAPSIGAFLLTNSDWTGIFYFLSALLFSLIILVIIFIPETHSINSARTDSQEKVIKPITDLINNRKFVFYLISCTGVYFALFGYISASSFIFQDELGMSPRQQAFMFGLNSLGLVGASILSTRIIIKRPPRDVAITALLALFFLSWMQLINVKSFSNSYLVIGLMFLSISMFGLIIGNLVSLALGAVPIYRGSASALIGLFQFSGGAIYAPLSTYIDGPQAFKMSVAMLIGAGLAAFLTWISD